VRRLGVAALTGIEALLKTRAAIEEKPILIANLQLERVGKSYRAPG